MIMNVHIPVRVASAVARKSTNDCIFAYCKGNDEEIGKLLLKVHKKCQYGSCMN